MISMDKKYKTASGIDARVLCIDAPGDFPVRVLIYDSVLNYWPDGSHCSVSSYNLVEVGPYDDFKIDEPCYFRGANVREWGKGYFAGVHHNGLAKRWTHGCTSWSAQDSDDFQTWNQCRRPTAEELAA